jgi:transcription antitermination factor NusG
MESWYALRVRSNHETVVQSGLRSRGFEEFLPVYRAKARWSDRVKVTQRPLFPGYVFARFDPSNRLPVLMLPGFVHIVGFGNGPEPVDEKELHAIRRFVDSGLPITPWPYLREGEMVVVQYGALSGLEGIVLRAADSLRLVVSLNLLQRSVAVELDRDMVRPLASSPRPRPVTQFNPAPFAADEPAPSALLSTPHKGMR